MRQLKTLMNPFIAAIERIKDRLQQPRRGSVLILVVALLVLLALIGTATLTTTRTDRYTSVQNTHNTQIDLLLEGVKNMAKGVIGGDLYDNGNYRPAGSAKYGPWTAPDLTNANTNTAYAEPVQEWLSTRIPVVANSNVAVSLATNPPIWLALGAPLNGNTFDSPFVTDAADVLQPSLSTVFTARRSDIAGILAATPGSVALKPDSITLNGRVFPAWLLPDSLGVMHKYLAGDADGDGIADSGMFRLPVGELNGLTYFASVRIIDEGSAINVNTAWTQQFDFDGAGTRTDPLVESFDFFPSQIGLAELLLTWNTAGNSPLSAASMGTEIDAINLYRWGRPTPSGIPSVLAADLPAGVVNNAANPQPIWDNNAARIPDDFRFLSLGDAMNRQLASRLSNPGRNMVNFTYKPFDMGDSVALAYRFVSLNPDASRSPLEDLLVNAVGPTNDSIYKSAWNYPPSNKRAYNSNEVMTGGRNGAGWYGDNFDLSLATLAGPPTAANQKPLRWMLTAYNPVSNLISSQASAVAPKTSINTAGFADLQVAFWNVMTLGGKTPFGDDPIDVTPPVDPPAWANGGLAHADDLNRGNHFTPVAPVVAPVAPGPSQNFTNFTPLAGDHIQRTFRSPIRDTRSTAVSGPGSAATAVRLSSDQVALLRSAIAAANTESMRLADPAMTANSIYPGNTLNPNNPPVVRTVGLQLHVGAGSPIAATAQIYGIHAQPIISEVYANNDTSTTTVPGSVNGSGYVAIELYNPFPTDLVLDGSWRLVSIDRTAASIATVKTLTTLHTFAGGVTNTIPAKGYLIVESYNPAVPTEYRPASTRLTATGAIADVTDSVNARVVYRVLSGVTELVTPTGTWDRELMLVRDVQVAAGAPVPANTVPVPIDSYDFTGLLLPVLSSNTAVWHYVRETYQEDASGEYDPMRFIYPGRYDGSQLASNPRQLGTQRATWDPAALQTDPFIATNSHDLNSATPPITLNWSPTWDFTVSASAGANSTLDAAYNYSASYSPRFIFQFLMPFNNQPSLGTPPGFYFGTAPNNAFPLGRFARNGDIQDVPFIGSYVIGLSDQTTTDGYVENNETIYELNSISMDSVFAEDTDITDDSNIAVDYAPANVNQGANNWREQLGRFCPIEDPLTFANGGTGSLIDDVNNALTGTVVGTTPYENNRTTPARVWRYRWALRLFDYLTVNAPHDDYFPNVKPNLWGTAGQTNAPLPVANVQPGVAGDSGGANATPNVENSVPVNGLVNINTAPWRVLAAIPWMPKSAGAHKLNTMTDLPNYSGSALEDDEFVAKLIVQWRDGIRLLDPALFPDIPVGKPTDPDSATSYLAASVFPGGGPFHSIFDLYQIKQFRDLQNRIIRTQEPDARLGDFSGTYDIHSLNRTFPDHVRLDFEERFLLLNRVSNFLTTQSDCFRVYIVLQGWRNANGSGTPELVVERRAAFIADRSSLTPGSPDLKTRNIPTD